MTAATLGDLVSSAAVHRIRPMAHDNLHMTVLDSLMELHSTSQMYSHAPKYS